MGNGIENQVGWTRIPAAVDAETDRRTLCAVLASIGLEVRIVRVKLTNRGTPKRFIEYRETCRGEE